MNVQHFADEADVAHRAVRTDEATEHVVDLGAAATDAAVDVVDGTAIVVLADDQYEITLPEEGAEAFIRNGVLTITTEDTA